jgi:hypothetical protein
VIGGFHSDKGENGRFGDHRVPPVLDASQMAIFIISPFAFGGARFKSVSYFGQCQNTKHKNKVKFHAAAGESLTFEVPPGVSHI